MLSSIALIRDCSALLAVVSNKGGVASTIAIIRSRATCDAAQNRKSDPMTRIIVASTHGGRGGAEPACVGGL